jgi:hypothetical protein
MEPAPYVKWWTAWVQEALDLGFLLHWEPDAAWWKSVRHARAQHKRGAGSQQKRAEVERAKQEATQGRYVVVTRRPHGAALSPKFAMPSPPRHSAPRCARRTRGLYGR